MTRFDGSHLLRERTRDKAARVTSVELFFDLVFVFPITQLSHALLHHLTPLGAVQILLLLLAVWWVWIYTAWATNWLDPDKTPVPLVLFLLMLAGPGLSASLPKAFQDPGPARVARAPKARRVSRRVFCGRLPVDADRPQPFHAVGGARQGPGGRRNISPH